MFSERSAKSDAPTNAWTLAVEARRARGDAIVDLTLSNPTQASLPYDGEAIRAALGAAPVLSYEPDPRGWIGAREALVERGLAKHPDHTFITASTSEAYGYLFTLLADPGDEILVPSPSYPLLAHLAHLAGVDLVPYEARYDGRWRVESAELFEAIGERTRAIVAVSPNNPTGAYLDADELDALAAFDLPLIVDEVFHAYPLEAPASTPRAFTAQETLVFSLDGASKRLALPQVKLGWIAMGGPSQAVQNASARLEWIADTYLSPSSAQRALPELLALQTAPNAIRDRIAANLDVLRRSCAGTAASVPKVEGGWYAAVRFPATQTDEAWALALVEQDGVLVHPGYFYDFPEDEAWLVVSLLTPPETFEQGAAQLARRAR